jgi:hypothetical protein
LAPLRVVDITQLCTRERIVVGGFQVAFELRREELASGRSEAIATAERVTNSSRPSAVS